MRILYRDRELVVVHKPAGLLVHRSDIARHESRFVLQLARNLLGQRVFPVHRLDRPTSGVLLLALSPEVARILMATFAAGQVVKRYLAVVRGVVAEEGTIAHPLVDEPDQHDPHGGRGGLQPQPAITRYRRLAQAELPVGVGRYPSSRYSLVEVMPLQGRRHQIRRHLRHISHPIIGDSNYGDGRHNRHFRAEFGCQRLLLHAVELSFTHPVTGTVIRVTAPLDEDFRQIINRLGWHGVMNDGMTGESGMPF